MRSERAARAVPFGEGGIGGRGGCGHSGLGPLRSDKASITARMSHALVEIPSDDHLIDADLDHAGVSR